jgi:cyclic pyranopterin phosphate synthase
MNDLSHFNERGETHMVDVGQKAVTNRVAKARGRVLMQAETLRLITQREVAKGDVLEVARLAGIMAAKRTGELIPLCHPLGLDSVTIAFSQIDERTLQIEATASIHAKTGVEMEAMTAVSVAALTVYDMCKSADRGMVIDGVCLVEKSGGKSGHYIRAEDGHEDE